MRFSSPVVCITRRDGRHSLRLPRDWRFQDAQVNRVSGFYRRSETSRRSADQAAGVSNPAFIRTHTDECGKCPDEVDNQGNNAVLPGTALDWTLTTTSRSTLISSRDAHSQISDAGAWRTSRFYCTSKNDDAHRVLRRLRRRVGCLQCDQKRREVRRAFCRTAAPSREPTGQPGQSGPGSPGRIPTISPLDHQMCQIKE